MKLRPVVSKMLLSDKYDELMNSESMGQYMHKHIIGHYEYERL